MLLALANSAAPGERIQQDLVHAPVKRSKLEPLLQIAKHLVVRGTLLDEVLQQSGVAAAESTPLRREPAIENRAASISQAVEKVSVEQRGEGLQPLRRERLDALLRCPGDLNGIDEAVGQVEPDGVAAGVDPSPTRLVEDAPDLAETPAKLAARIVGDVPQQFAKVARATACGASAR